MEDKKFEDALNKAKELEVIDFKTISSFDYKEYYSAIESIAIKNNNFKNEEAETVIKDFAPKFTDEKYIIELKNRRESVLDLIRKFDPNSEDVKNMAEHDVDKVYAISNYLLNSYVKYINEMLFDMEMKKEEFLFLDRVLTKTIEYSGDDVFNYTEFYDSFWAVAKAEYDTDKSKDKYTFKISIKTILLLHHLIKGYKVKGSGLEFRYLKDILYWIGQTNKIFNAFNITVERLKDDCKLWGNSIDLITQQKNSEAVPVETINDSSTTPLQVS